MIYRNFNKRTVGNRQWEAGLIHLEERGVDGTLNDT